MYTKMFYTDRMSTELIMANLVSILAVACNLKNLCYVILKSKMIIFSKTLAQCFLTVTFSTLFISKARPTSRISYENMMKANVQMPGSHAISL